MKKYRHIPVLLLALLLSLTACGGGEPAQDEDENTEAGVAVQVETVVQDTIAAENKVSGKISADNEAVIMIASTAKCTAVYFEAGDQVAAGDILCTLELGSALANYNSARIGYNGAVQSYSDQKAVLDKQVQLAADNVSNTKALFEIGAASQLEVDQAELNYSNAVAGRNSALTQLESAIQSAKSGLAQLDTALENVDPDGNVLAPMAGTLVTMSAVENSFISNSMPLAVIDGPDQMKVSVSVSEALVPKITIGSQADVYVSAIDRRFSAVIRSVEQAANVQTRLYTVTLTVPADVGGLLSGMFADVTFFTDVSQNAVVVPTEAILTSGGTQYVYVVEGSTAHCLEVTTGLTGNGVTEVTEGLTAGQQLVTVGQAYLHDGDPVRVVSGEG
ncbi:efflux RND transporter periplasmic adaptor subunit [Oscillibacter sp.]|jgi:RND family efflux transporter MFP subunit|uniref:efflux RND transporter periplasmic adaptor subunit n=1 Tax=Oscillibacter sp. TaxID=1945593 RepID=UPI00216EE395|nr:efflux RND transporter periplasmic adaptor subunit [Oscillibacter sp.]MCI9649800.1 efflux RND transporter periplasmic adaptor subunit [Oscillibacter sp.]